MSGHTLNDIVGDIANPIYTSTVSLQAMTNDLCNGATYTMFHHYSEDEFPVVSGRGIFINHAKVIDMICVKAGYTSSIDNGVDLSKVFLFCRDWYFNIRMVSSGNYAIDIKSGTKNQYKSISVLLKQICLLNGIYFTVDEATKIVYFHSISALLENKSSTSVFKRSRESSAKVGLSSIPIPLRPSKTHAFNVEPIPKNGSNTV